MSNFATPIKLHSATNSTMFQYMEKHVKQYLW